MVMTELPSLTEIVRQALRLEPAIYAAIQHAPEGIWLALIVVILAALSESIGQSIILFVNRVRPRRFILALLIATMSRFAGFGMWAVSVWLVVGYLFERTLSLRMVVSAVGLAYAPQLFAFFVLTPFLGNAFSILLSLWSMIAIIVAVRVGMGLEMWQAVVASALGWLLIQIWQRTLGRPLYALDRWLSRLAAGVALEWTAQDLARLRHRPKWLQNLPDWHEWQERAESYLRTINIAGGDGSRGNDFR